MEQDFRVRVRPVTTCQDAKLFLDLPYTVYAADAHWVPPLRTSVAKQFGASNPFFRHGRLQRFIAVTADNQAAGRVVAAVDDRLIKREGRPIGLFGFFECIDDPDVAKALLDAACDWLRQQGMQSARGPIDLSITNNCFFLVDGFDSPPCIRMPYNPPYYSKYAEQAGWHKAKDAYAYDLRPAELAEKFGKAYRIAEKAYSFACNSGVSFRSIRTRGDGFRLDCANLHQLFTDAFLDTWSLSPYVEDEFVEEVKNIKSIIDPSIFWIAEYERKMIGFFMALPDYNIPLKYAAGKLPLVRILQIMWYRRRIDRGRVLAICVLPEHRSKMVAPALIYLGAKGGFMDRKKPYRRAELSWIYEDNMPSRRLVEASGAKIHKTYRVYEKSLL